MARNLSRSRRKEIRAKKKQSYVLEHQRELAEAARKRYLLMLDPETNRTQLRSLERSTPAFGLRAAFGAMMERVFRYAPTPIPTCDIEHFRFHTVDCTDDYSEMLLRWHQARLLERQAA